MGNRIEPTRLAGIGTVVACIGAGVFWLAGMAVTPWENGHSDTAATLSHLGQAELAPVLLHFGFMLTVPACIGLAWLAARRAPIAAAVTICLAVLGSSVSGFLAMDFYDLAVAQSVPLAQANAISERVGSFPSAMIIIVPSIFALLLAMIGATVATWRAGLVPVWLVIVMAGAATYGQLFSKGYALPSIGSAAVVCYVFLHLAYGVARARSAASSSTNRAELAAA